MERKKKKNESKEYERMLIYQEFPEVFIISENILSAMMVSYCLIPNSMPSGTFRDFEGWGRGRGMGSPLPKNPKCAATSILLVLKVPTYQMRLQSGEAKS